MKSIKSIIVLVSLSLLISIRIFGQDFSFAAMSDSRGSYNGVNEPVLTALTAHLVANHPEAKFLLFMGDMIGGNKDNPEKTFIELTNWKRIMQPVYSNPNMIWPFIWPAIGNHEVQHREDENNFRKTFSDVFMNGPEDEKGLTYSFDYNNVHFTAVHTDRWNYGSPDDTTDDTRDWHYVKHLDWLENDLKKANERNVDYIFVMGHEMPFPAGGHLRDGLPNLGRDLRLPLDSTRQWYLNQRNKFWSILKENKVNAYLCGHEHLYSRQSVDGIYQVINGSAGAPLYYFNPKFGDNPEEKKYGQEFTYNEAVPYYEVLNYSHGPGKNSQASEDFFGLRAFHYSVYGVTKDGVSVRTFGSFPKEGSQNEMGTEIKLIDEFFIPKK